MEFERLRPIGARRPTGSVVSPGRQLFLGGDCPAPYAAGPQLMLPIHGQFGRRRGLDPGSVPARLSYVGQLSGRAWSFPDMAFERDAQPAGRSLSPHATRSAHRFHRRHDAAGRREARYANTSRRGRADRIERAASAGAATSFARTAGSGYLARFAGIGLQRSTKGFAGAARHGEITNQSRTHRIGARPRENGSTPGVGSGR